MMADLPLLIHGSSFFFYWRGYSHTARLRMGLFSCPLTSILLA